MDIENNNISICVNCDYYVPFNINYYGTDVNFNNRCMFYIEKGIVDFIKGEEFCFIPYCDRYNKNGECKNFKQITFWTELKRIFKHKPTDPGDVFLVRQLSIEELKQRHLERETNNDTN
jgi:hypothetical protein